MERKQTLTDKYQYWNIITKVPSAETQRDLSLWDQSSICRKFPTVHVNSSVPSLSHAQLFATPWTAACQVSLSITSSQNLLKLMFIESVMPSHPLLSTSNTAFNLSQHQDLFQWVCSMHQVAKVLELQLQHLSFQILFVSFRIDWFDLLAVQGTLKSLPQHHSSKASLLQHSAFFIVQLSQLYTTTGKTIALTKWTFVSKVMSLLFNMLSRLVVAFLPKSKCLLNSWLQSPSTVILETSPPPPKKNSLSLFLLFPHLFAMKW